MEWMPVYIFMTSCPAKYGKSSGYRYDQKIRSGIRKAAIFRRKTLWIPLRPKDMVITEEMNGFCVFRVRNVQWTFARTDRSIIIYCENGKSLYRIQEKGYNINMVWHLKTRKLCVASLGGTGMSTRCYKEKRWQSRL